MGAAFDGFGASVSFSGDTALVGSFQDDDNGIDSGSAYLFVRDGAGIWGQQDKLTASDGAESDGFGSSVSISGDSALVGAFQNDGAATSSGSAYVFARDGAGSWSQETKLAASDGASSDLFGGAVASSDDTALVGASQDDDAGSDSGSSYVFVPCLAPDCGVSIIQPPDGAVFNSGTAIIFQATATDPEDGDIRASTVWTSDIQPGSRSGSVVEATNMIDGEHIITATTTDSAGNTLSESITITVSNEPPTVVIIQPLDGAVFDSGEQITFLAAAADPEDGGISDSIAWTSDIQEGSVTGAVLQSSGLIDGVHTVTASVTDSLGNTSTDSITITVGGSP